MVLTNSGGGRFGSNATYIVGNKPLGVTAADVNGDSKLDLISANWTDFTLTVLTNNTEFPPPPALNLALSNTVSDNQLAVVYLVYPWSGKNYTLLTTTNLASPVWLPATNSVSTSNGPSVVTVTISNTAPAAFYRLSNP